MAAATQPDSLLQCHESPSAISEATEGKSKGIADNWNNVKFYAHFVVSHVFYIVHAVLLLEFSCVKLTVLKNKYSILNMTFQSMVIVVQKLITVFCGRNRRDLWTCCLSDTLSWKWRDLFRLALKWFACEIGAAVNKIWFCCASWVKKLMFASQVQRPFEF